MMGAKLSLRGVNVWYGDLHALKGINMGIAANKVTALIGPSGCGKSTLIRSLNRLNDTVDGCKTTGEMLLDGGCIRDIEAHLLRKRVGMVFQKPNPLPISIYENVASGPRVHGTRSAAKLDEIVERALRSANLWNEVKDRLRKNAMSLSGGQQQRLCIARALAVEPEVLLMDEPTSALDPKSTAKIEELVAHLKSQYTVVIVTHNLQQAARVSDYTGFILDGELVEFGETKQVFTKPSDQRCADYITGKFG